ncbi:MAG: lactoylglutathione lyase [Clostridiaceae bacterium]|jgi:lactoylglutathione lyase|nr:VOC family protein [Bacillota bacterium]NLN51497.1 lactoylglutathione lyase [Clostridiaceae bacterium]
MDFDFKMVHMNINTMDLEKADKFYRENLGLKEARRKEAEDGSYIIVYYTDSNNDFEMEITWLRDRKEPYDLEDNEIHLCFRTEKYDEALAFHREQGVVVLENENMGVYFIEDHDGYWIEIAPYRD